MKQIFVFSLSFFFILSTISDCHLGTKSKTTQAEDVSTICAQDIRQLQMAQLSAIKMSVTKDGNAFPLWNKRQVAPVSQNKLFRVATGWNKVNLKYRIFGHFFVEKSLFSIYNSCVFTVFA